MLPLLPCYHCISKIYIFIIIIILFLLKFRYKNNGNSGNNTEDEWLAVVTEVVTKW